MESEKKKRSFSKKDIFLLGGMLLVGAVIFHTVTLLGGSGETVEVRVDGQLVDSYPLSADREEEIQGAGGTNHLVIRNGEAWIASASCPDGLCVNMGKISKNGQSVICLPNRVVVQIVGENENADEESSSGGADIIVK